MLAQHEIGIRVRSVRRLAAASCGLAALLLLAACDSAEERKVSHYESGLELVEEGEPGKAILEFTNALRIDDKFIPAHAELGRLHREAGRPAKAAGHLEIVAEARPEDVETRLELARIYLDLRALDRALAASDAALELAPENPGALAVRSAVDLLLGETESAETRARAALEADPEALLARLTRVALRLRADDPRGALEILEAAPSLNDEDGDIGLELIRIRVLERMGDREAVGAALERLLEIQPENEGLRLALARWHMQGEPPDIEAAEVELRAIAELSPDEAAPRLRVVDFLRQTKGEAAARAELERLIAEAGEGGPEAARYERALAVAEARAGDREAAIARLEAAVAREGESDAGDAARLLLARLAQGEDAEERRAALIEAVLSRDSANAEALAMRAQLAIRDDRPDDAIQDLRAALEQAPRETALLELLATAHERNGDDALAAERRALAVQASDSAPGPSLRYAAQLLREGKLATVESVLLDALQNAPRNRRLLTALAETRLRNQDWAGARQAVAALESLEGEEAGGVADQLRAATLFGEGRAEETFEVLQQNWERGRDGVNMEALVRAYAASGELERAGSFLDRVLEENPENTRALALKAEVKAAQGEAEAAEEILRQAIAAAPEDPRLHRLMANFLQASGRMEEADAALEAGLAAVPDDPQLRFDKAMRLEAENRVEEAIAIYEDLYDEDPDNTAVANNLASLLSDHREDAESLERAAAVARRLRGSPLPAFQDTYGWTLHLTGESAQAAAVLRESAPQLPRNAIAQYHLGMAYAAIDQRELAMEQLRRALELADADAFFPQRETAEAELARLEAEAEAEAETTDSDE